MREVFSSQRLENVERAAKLLEDAGIEVWISNGRSYKGSRRRHFSYRNNAPDQRPAAVWVVRSDDQPLARQIMIDAGLGGDTTRRDSESYLPESVRSKKVPPPTAMQRIIRYRRLLLIAIALIAALVLINTSRLPPPEPPAPADEIIVVP